MKNLIAALILIGCPLVAFAEETPDTSPPTQVQFESQSAPESDSTPRRFNLQTSPVALIARRYNASVEVGVSRSLTLGLKGTTFPQSALSGLLNTSTGYEAGLRSTWYATSDRLEDGLIFRGSAYYKNTKTYHGLDDFLGNVIVQTFTLGTAHLYETRDVVIGPEFEFMGGYQMVLKNGINFDWNIGLATYQEYTEIIDVTTGNREEISAKKWKVAPVIEFNIGYAF